MRPRLRSFELAWTDAAFDAIYPEPPPPSRGTPARFPHGIVRLHPARFFDDLLVEAPLEQSLGLRFAIWVVALAPVFTLNRPTTIAGLSSADRVRVLEKLLSSPIYVVRQLVVSLKAMATILYASSPQVRARMLAPIRESTGQLIRLRAKDRPVVEPKLVATEGGEHEHAAE